MTAGESRADETEVERRWAKALGAPARGALWPPALLALVYLAVVIAAGARLDDPLYAGWLVGAKVPALVDGGQWWRLVTASFIHLAPWHLVGNAVAAWYLGRVACWLFGPARVWLVFVGCAVAGTVASQFLVDRWSLGASGGVFGLLGALLGFALRRGRHVPRRFRPRLGWRPAPWALALLALTAGLAGGRVDHVAHFTALGVGLLAGSLLPAIPLGARRHTPLTTAGILGSAAVLAWASVGAVRHARPSDARREVVDAARDLVYAVPAAWVEARPFDRHTCAASYTDGLVHVCVGGRPAIADRRELIDALSLDAHDAGFSRLEARAPALAPGWQPLGTLVGDAGHRAGQSIAIYARPGPAGDRVALVHALTANVTPERLRRDVAPILASVRPRS